MTHHAKKRFGQNFLHHPHFINNIILAIQANSDETVIEVGPGLGAITRPLSQQLKQLHVIEIDRDIIEFLKQQEYNSKIIIHNTDVLRFDFNRIAGTKKIIGNLPYNISTPLLFKLTEYYSTIDSMYFMLQKEVVDRLIASPNSSQYGKLTILLQYFFDIELLFEVPPDAFSPQPKVNSAFIRILPNMGQHGIAKDFALFSKLVKKSFSMRRKTLYNNIKELVTKDILLDLNISPAARAENISISQYILLANYLYHHSLKSH